MLSDEQRRRIQELNRQRMKFALTPASQLLPRAAEAKKAAKKITLAEAAPGEEVQLDSGGACWVIRRPASEFWPGAAEVRDGYRRALAGGLIEGVDALSPEVRALVDAGPEAPLFMDLETCGLGGTPLFLVGLMWYADGELHVEQLFARDYSEEPTVLRMFWRRLPWHPSMVTFNGKTFDWPKVHERSIVGRVRPTAEPLHLDLLHEARRRWRRELPNCRLQTLELMLCKRGRSDDIPGAQIPDAYHNFVRKGNARLIKKILHHNALDLITMAELLTRLLTGHEDL